MVDDVAPPHSYIDPTLTSASAATRRSAWGQGRVGHYEQTVRTPCQAREEDTANVYWCTMSKQAGRRVRQHLGTDGKEVEAVAAAVGAAPRRGPVAARRAQYHLRTGAHVEIVSKS